MTDQPDENYINPHVALRITAEYIANKGGSHWSPRDLIAEADRLVGVQRAERVGRDLVRWLCARSKDYTAVELGKFALDVVDADRQEYP